MSATYTRRVVLATAAALARAQAQQKDPEVRLGRPVRVGIFGTEGHTGEITGPLLRLPDVRITAIAAANAEAARGIAERHRCKVYGGLPEMLRSGEIDLVAVLNDNGGRAAAILQCVERGLHVIAEKPLALNTPDLDRIRKAVADRGVKLGCLLPMRFEPHYLAMRETVRGGAVGEVAQIAAQKSYKAGTRPEWFLKRATYGGTIAWIGIHMIDLMIATTGRDIRRAAGLQNRIGSPHLKEMENVTASLFELDNGGLATLRLDYCRTETAPTHGDDRLRIAGTKGIIEWSEASGLVLMTDERAPAKLERLPAAQSVFIDFLEHVYRGKPTGLPLEEIYRGNQITIAAQRAADEKSWVPV